MRIVVIALLALVQTARADCELVVTDSDAAMESATCFDNDGQLAAALQSYDFVLRQFPRSKEIVRATRRSGEIYAQLAQYDQAAKRFEDYAERFAGEKDAFDALQDAIRFRAALGDRARWIEDTKFFIRLYGLKRQEAVAEAMFALTPAFDGADRVKHLREYLRMFGEKGGAERLVQAHVQIGELLWQGSCPVALVDGLCARRVSPPASACSRVKPLVAVARDSNATNEAAAELRAGMTAFERSGSKDLVTAAAYARAKLLLADRLLEASIHPLPRMNLVTQGAQHRSNQRFQTWLADQQKSGEAIRRMYEDVLALKQPIASITAAARLGQLVQNFSEQILAAPQPHDLRREFSKERAEAFCDAITQVTEPLAARAVEAFALCAEKANMLGVANEWTQLCMHQLEVAKPDEFPRFREKIAKPHAWSVPLEVAAERPSAQL